MAFRRYAMFARNIDPWFCDQKSFEGMKFKAVHQILSLAGSKIQFSLNILDEYVDSWLNGYIH
jgi:hypothetical protein